jgi:hypothetical protein
MLITYNKLRKSLIGKKMNRTISKVAAGISFNIGAKRDKDEAASMKSKLKTCQALDSNIFDIVGINK